MAMYIKRPVIIEAVQFLPENAQELRALANRSKDCHLLPIYGDDGEWQGAVSTLEGVMRGNKGDWLILGVARELYFCRDDIFRNTYDSAPTAIE